MLEYEVWTQHAKKQWALLKQPVNTDNTGDSWDIFKDFFEHFVISENNMYFHKWSFKVVEKSFIDAFQISNCIILESRELLSIIPNLT